MPVAKGPPVAATQNGSETMTNSDAEITVFDAEAERAVTLDRVAVEQGGIATLNTIIDDDTGTSINGTAAADTIFGNGGDDSIWSGAGDDIVYGGTGNDRINGQAGGDRMDGGAGDDYFRFADGAGENAEAGDVALGGIGYDHIEIGNNARSDLRLLQTSSIEEVWFNNPNTYSYAWFEDSQFGPGGLPNDLHVDWYINQRSTFYVIVESNGSFSAENFTFQDYTKGTHQMYLYAPSSAGPVEIKGSTIEDTIYGGGSDDLLVGLFGDDTIAGNNGNDLIYAGGRNDTAYGGDGNDRVAGGLGDDLVIGGDGFDVVIGGKQHDVMWAYDENSTTGDSAGNNLFGGAGADEMHGNSGEDKLLAGIGNDVVYGYAGNDTINGGKGRDVLYGGDGDDLIIGNFGPDTLEGGNGQDIFVFGPGVSGTVGGRIDLVMDFDRNEGDQISLRAFDGDSTRNGNQEMEFIGLDTAFTDEGQVRLDTSTGYLELNLDNDAGVEMRIDLLGVTFLNASDFIM